jgi:hypothetical protein
MFLIFPIEYFVDLHIGIGKSMHRRRTNRLRKFPSGAEVMLEEGDVLILLPLEVERDYELKGLLLELLA